MYEFAYLRKLLTVVSHAFMVFVGFNILMWVTTTVSPDFLSVPKQFFGVDFVKKNFHKVDDLKSYYRGELASQDYPLYVFMGLSGASEGIDTQSLQQNIGEQINLVSLSGAGRNVKEISIYAEPLINSALTPSLVIFAISPFHLMAPPVEQKSLMTVLQETPQHHLLAGWFAIKRNDIKHLADMKILNTRMNLFDWLDFRVDKENPQSWRQDTLMGMTQLLTEAEWKSRLDEYGKRGYYQLANYQNSQNQIALFARLIKQFQSKGSEVIVLLMPEHSSLRKMIPRQTMKILLGQLSTELQHQQMPQILDFRQSVTDEGFTDISHLNRSGRDAFTESLNKLLRQKSNEL